ncbi:MAG: ElyC/SanA/YdcF family protein [Pirellulaceae bacterium]
MRTGVLIHGCNLNIENWRHVAWGDQPTLLGRIPQGLLAAYEMDAEVIVFGTGASEKAFRLGDSPRNGEILFEAEYSFEYLKMSFDSLKRFGVWRKQVPEANDDARWSELKEKLLSRIILDCRSQNTHEELDRAGQIFLEHDLDRIVLVSSPSHIVRCLRDAGSVYDLDGPYSKFANHVLACPSNTCYEGTSPSDVVVIEPPHRPDRHVVPTHRRIQRMLALQRLDQGDLVHLIEDFDDLLQRYEHRFFDA